MYRYWLFKKQSFLIITYTQRRHDDLEGKDKAAKRLGAILCFCLYLLLKTLLAFVPDYAWYLVIYLLIN